MIVHVDLSVPEEKVAALAAQREALYFRGPQHYVVVDASQDKVLEGELAQLATAHFVMEGDLQLTSRAYHPQTRTVRAGGVVFGGASPRTVVIAGPCAAESEEQLRQTAELLQDLGVQVLRAGSYKPRTSPYTFKGLGLEGLKLLSRIRDEYGLTLVTEVRDATHADEVLEAADIVQVGARSMYDQAILRKCAQSRKPIILKRSFGATIHDFVQSAEFILAGGNDQVILCERGIRTFENRTRFTLDLCGVAYLKQHTNLPIIVDPSHAMGWAYGVPDLARACVAMGVDGLLIEVHPEPAQARSDPAQQLDHPSFRALHASLKPIADAVGRPLA